MPLHPLIISDPAVLTGKPVVRGTRVPVQTVLKRLAAGETAADLVADLPGLTLVGINACLAYAAAAVDSTEVMPLAIGA